MEEGFFYAPGFWGHIKDKKVVAYVQSITTEAREKSGNWSVIDVVFKSPLPDNVLVMASKGLFNETVGSIDGLESFIPNDLNWEDKTPLYTDSPDLFRSYLNRDNVKSLNDLKKLKECEFSFFLQSGDSFVSCYTRKPLQSPKEINIIVKTLLEVANVWEKERELPTLTAKSTEGLAFEEDSAEASNAKSGADTAALSTETTNKDKPESKQSK